MLAQDIKNACYSNKLMSLLVLTLFNERLAISNELQSILRLPYEYEIDQIGHECYTSHTKWQSKFEHRFCFERKKCGRWKHELSTGNNKNGFSNGRQVFLIPLRRMSANALLNFLKKLEKLDWTGHVDKRKWIGLRLRLFELYL